MQDRRIFLVAGLGNPGARYASTRHNAGFMVIDKLAETFSIRMDTYRFDTVHGYGCIRGVETVLAKPMAYMNRSGPPLRHLADFYTILCRDMVVIHDDIDLAFGRLKIKEKGGNGGHNGLKSMMDAFGGGDFARLRVGIGRPGTGTAVTDYVLGGFGEEEKKLLPQMIETARDAAVTLLCEGIRESMNRFNRKSKLTP